MSGLPEQFLDFAADPAKATPASDWDADEAAHIEAEAA